MREVVSCEMSTHRKIGNVLSHFRCGSVNGPPLKSHRNVSLVRLDGENSCGTTPTSRVFIGRLEPNIEQVLWFVLKPFQ